MDVIYNAAENRSKCDDHKHIFDLVDINKTLNASNANIEPIPLFIDDKNITNQPIQVGNTKNLDVVTINDKKLDNVDNINQLYKYEDIKFIVQPKAVISVEDDNNVIRRSLDTCNIYNSDNLKFSDNMQSTLKSDTSVTACTTKQNKSSTEENKISPNETSSDTFTKDLFYPSLDESFKIGAICPSNSFYEKKYTDINQLDRIHNKKSSQSVNINQVISSKISDAEIFVKSDSEIMQPDSCLLLTEKCLQDSFVIDDNKLNTSSTSRSMKSYECRDKMMNENKVNTYNNSEVACIKQQHCLKNQNVNSTKFLSTFKDSSFENEPQIFNRCSPDIKPSVCSFIQHKFKNHINKSSMTPIAISNTKFYENKLEDQVSSSNIDRKNLVNVYSNVISPENVMKHNTISLGEKKPSHATSFPLNTRSNLKMEEDLKDFIKESEKNNFNRIENSNYAVNNFQFSQPCSEYDKYKLRTQADLQNGRQEEHNFSSTCNDSYNKNYSKINYTDDKIIRQINLDNSLSSWNKDDSQRKNICEYNKITQPMPAVSSLVHATNGNNSNISMVDGRCPKFTIQFDADVELRKQHQYQSCDLAAEPLLSANKLSSYVNSHINTKQFNKKYLPPVPTKNKTLTQLQMNPPDFSRISLIESTQKENESTRNSNEYNSSRKKKYLQSVSSQSFADLSKKFNYIKDLQLKNPINNDYSSFKEVSKKNFEPQNHNSYSNLYVKTPDFSAENFIKSEKIQNLCKTHSLSNFNNNPMSALSNELPTTESNVVHSKSYPELSYDKSTIAPNNQSTAILNETNTSYNIYNQSKNNSSLIETNMMTDDEYYPKKFRDSNNGNQYYSSYPLLHDKNLTSTYQGYNQDINMQTNVRNKSVPNAHLQNEQFSQNYFEEINNYRNSDGNMDYNIKRTTSVIQSGKHVNLGHTSNFINSRLKHNSLPQSLPNNWNSKPQPAKSPQEQLPKIMAVASSPANLQSPANIACGWQTKNEKTKQESSTHHKMHQKPIGNGSLQNAKPFQTAQKSVPMTKSIIKQLKNPSHLPQNCNSNSYCRNSQTYSSTPAVNDQHLFLGNMDKNTAEHIKYKQNNNKPIEYGTQSYTEQTKYVKTSDCNNVFPRPVFKNSTSFSTKCSPETSRTLLKPNYREMINHVYAMRNSTTEDDLNLQIIKRTLNCDISLRKSENDLSQNIFDFPVSKKSSSTYLGGNSFYYPRSEEKSIMSSNVYNIDNSQNGYTESSEAYQDESHNMSIADNDISVTLSKIIKSKEINPFTVEMKNKINLTSDYPKAIITKVVSRKIDNNMTIDIDCTDSPSHMASNQCTPKKNTTVPLDLSVKTVKTIADSTGCDDGNNYNRIRIVEGIRSAPKFVFQPNFSNTSDINYEQNTILQSVTSSITQKKTPDVSTYSKLMQTKNEIQELNAGDGKYCSNKIDGSEFKLQPVPESKISEYENEHYIVNINKIKSKLLLPPADTDLSNDGNSIYEYQKEHPTWQQSGDTQNVNRIHQNNILLPTPDKFENKCDTYLLKRCNNSNEFLEVQNLDISANTHSKIYNYDNKFLEKTNNIEEYMTYKQQIGNKNRNQNKIIRNNTKNIDTLVHKTQNLPKAIKIDDKLDIDYSIRKRPLDITKQTPAKKIRVDDIYRAHLEENSKKQTTETFNNKIVVDYISEFSDIPSNSQQKYENNKQILCDPESNPELGYSHLPSQKLHRKIWYPPMEVKCNQEKVFSSHIHKSHNNVLPNGPVNYPSSNFIISKGVDQSVISKLKNSIEMRENEKQKLAKCTENNERNEETSKSDIASLLAARIRTKGELKGFHQPDLAEIKNIDEPNDKIYSEAVTATPLSINVDDISEYEQNSSLNLLDWRSACNDFVEQLKCSPNKKRNKRPRNTQTSTDNKQPGTIKISEMKCICDIKNTTVDAHCTLCIKRSLKELTSDSSDEDKPLLFLRQQNKSQVNSVSPKNTETDETFQTLVCKESILQICQDLDEPTQNKSTHSSIVEKLSEKIGRNIREKQRIEQEKRLAARLGKTSSSESEDNIRNHRPKKVSKMTKTRNSTGVSTRELSDTDSSGPESISMSKNILRSREVAKKRKCINLENVKINGSNIFPSKTTESNIELTKAFSEKQVMTKAEMKFMVPSKDIHRNIIEQNGATGLFLNKNEDEVKSKKSSNCEINSSKNLNAEINKSKNKKISSSAFHDHNTEIKLEETMTRSKKKKALENQIANSKILRNDKIINYVYIARNKKTNNKKNGENIRESKNSRLKSEAEKKNCRHKNGISLYSSASSVECETVSNRLRPRRLSLDNNRNLKRKGKCTEEAFKQKVYDRKKNKLSPTHSKGIFFKKKVDKEQIEKYNSSKFPPGWEDQVYEYKKSLKVPLRLITITGPHNHRISTSLPDLDSHSSDDATENSSIASKQRLISHQNDTKRVQESISLNNDKSAQKLAQTFLDNHNNCKEDVTQEKNSPPKSIIDVLHSRVIRSKKIPKKNVKTFNIYEPKVLPRSTNELELLPAPTVPKNAEALNEHHNMFKTEILKSRTRTETRNLRNKELIREVFGGEDRPASAPPEIRKTNNNVETLSFEEKYEQYLQKMNIDFGEKIRKEIKPIIMLNNQTNDIENKDLKDLIKNEDIDGNDSSFRASENNDMHDKYIKRCLVNSEVLKDKTLKIISNRDCDVGQNLFKHKKNSKYRSGRRKGSSGFDYIRKKKKPPSAITSLINQDYLKRKKVSPEELHHTRDEKDVCKEIQKWVLNKSVGQSALHKAARLGYLDVIAYCLERMGMNPDPKDNAGYTPLHEACSKGRIDIARVLLQYGANHSETAHSGIRPLHEASENGYIEIVRLLLSYGADPLLTTYSGQTPLMLSDSNEMEQFIKNHLYDVQNTGPHKQPWKFQGPWKIFDPYKYGYDVLSGAPESEDVDASDKCFQKENSSLSVDIIDKDKFVLKSSCNVEENKKVNSSIAIDDGEVFQLEEADIPLPPLYLLKDEGSSKWVLLSDLCNLLKVKSKDTLLKQICPSTPPSTMNKELLRELKMSDFLEKATCLQLLCAGEKLNIRSSKVILVKYNERVQTLLGVKTVVMKF